MRLLRWKQAAIPVVAVAAMFGQVTLGVSAAAAAPQPASLSLVLGPVPAQVRAGTPMVVLEVVHQDNADGPVVSGQGVNLLVTAGPDAGEQATATTGPDGVASLQYDTTKAGPNGGTDVVQGWIDTDANGALSAGEPSNSNRFTILPTVNLPPLAGSVKLDTPQDIPVSIQLPGRDPDGTKVGFSIVTQPTHGSLPGFSGGAVVQYVPDTGYVGTDFFVYRVTDSDGASAQNRVDLTLTANAVQPPPTAMFTVTPLSGDAPLAVTVDSTTQQLGDDQLIGWHWEFGDNTPADGVNSSHTYQKAGTYQVSLTVTTASGAKSTASQTVTVTAPPVAPPPPRPSRTPMCDGHLATIVMTPGQGMVFGTDGPDVIVGTSGDDSIFGMGGDDIICGAGGNDTIHGGAGDDTIFGFNGNDTIYGGPGNDVIYGGNGNDQLYGGTGDDQLFGDSGNDRLYGGDGNDTLTSGPGTDFLSGGPGDDTLIANRANDILRGGSGTDTFESGGRQWWG